MQNKLLQPCKNTIQYCCTCHIQRGDYVMSDMLNINCTVLNVKIPCILDFLKSTNCIQLYNLLKCNKSITDRGGFMRGRGGGRNNTLNDNIFKWLITAKIIWQCIVNIMKQNYGVILQVTNNSNKCVTVETKLCQIKCHFDCVMKSMKLNTLYSYFGNAL